MPSHCLQLIKPALFSNEAIQIYRHAEADYLLASWLSVSDAQNLFTGFKAIIEAVREQHVRGLLTSMDGQDTPAPGVLPNIINCYLPEIINAGVSCFATVLPSRIYSLTTVEIVISSIPQSLQVESFHDVLLAHSWLQDRLLSLNCTQ